jgi:cytochrome c553
MNRAYPAVVKSLFVVLLATASFANAAEDQPAAQSAVKADPAKGETLFTAGDASRNVTACLACHGAGGNSTIAQNPKLSGQPAPYIAKQLHDFKSGARNNPVMVPIAKALNDQDIANLTAYLDKQKPSAGAAKNKDTVELGKKIFRGGIAEKNVPACAACHSADGHGIPAQYPRIAGQHQEYTAAQLTAFRDGTRKNSDPMNKIASRLSDQEIQAVADYVAGLK